MSGEGPTLNAENAAKYVGVSKSTFLREVAIGYWPKPIPRPSKRIVWLKDSLDRKLKSLDQSEVNTQTNRAANLALEEFGKCW